MAFQLPADAKRSSVATRSSGALFPLSFVRLPAVGLHSAFHDVGNQIVRNRLIEWEAQIPLLSSIHRDSTLKLRISNGRIQADVLLEGAEVNDVLVQRERRQVIANPLSRRWSHLPDCLPYLLQYFLNVSGKG